MIIFKTLTPKRELWCHLSNLKSNFKFKGKTWKYPKKGKLKLFRTKDNGMTFHLYVYDGVFGIGADNANGYNNKYILNFYNSFLDSLSKRPKKCDDCIHRFKYRLSKKCNDNYIRSNVKPE